MKILVVLFIEQGKLILTFLWKCKAIKIFKETLNKNKKDLNYLILKLAIKQQ